MALVLLVPSVLAGTVTRDISSTEVDPEEIITVSVSAGTHAQSQVGRTISSQSPELTEVLMAAVEFKKQRKKKQHIAMALE